MARQRIFYLDNLCGLLIINMIFMVHLAGFSGVGDSTLMYYVKMSLGFFMSWFFFKAGMFFKEQPIKTIVRSSSKRLLVPYVVFNILGIVCSWIITFCHSVGGVSFGQVVLPVFQLLYDEATVSNMALWFLLSLFVVKVVFALLYRTKISAWIQFILFFILAWGMNYYLYVVQPSPKLIPLGSYHFLLQVPSYLGNFCFGLAMYSLGLLMRDRQYTKPVLVLAVIVYLVQFFFPSAISMKEDKTTGPFPLAFAYSLAGIIVFDNIFRRFLNKSIPVLTHVGRNSMIYYVTHYVFLSVVFSIIDTRTMNTWLLFVGVSVLMCMYFFLMDFIFTRPKLQWMVGIRTKS